MSNIFYNVKKNTDICSVEKIETVRREKAPGASHDEKPGRKILNHGKCSQNRGNLRGNRENQHEIRLGQGREGVGAVAAP